MFIHPTGYSQPGHIVDSDGTTYSEYFQCLIYTEDRSLSFDALVTLGNERLPNAYELPPAKTKYLSSPDTIISVNEVYLRNHSSSPITVTDLVISEGMGSFSRRYHPETFVIPAKGVLKSDAIVDVTSLYGPTELPCSMQFEISGQNQNLIGTWRRLGVRELSR